MKKKAKPQTQMQRLDADYRRYLIRRAKREGITVVALTRRMLATIHQAMEAQPK